MEYASVKYKCSDAYILKPHVKKCPLVIENGGKYIPSILRDYLMLH